MAIYNGRILMRKGLEADFDASKLMSGEWAVSTDKGIIRICLQAGTVIRMATYEAFEEDMKQVEEILLECKSVEEAVVRINTEINAKVDAVVEYVGQAKTYRDEALQFRNEAEAFKNQAGDIVGIGVATTEKAGIVKPDGTTIRVDADGTIHADAGTADYTELENKPSINGTELDGNKTLDDLGIASKTELEKTNYKVDTIIEKADLGIKETATGEEIHLTDSAEGKAVEFALYGKARQNTTSGKNLLIYPFSETTHTENGITWTDNGDGTVTANGTATNNSNLMVYTVGNEITKVSAGKYIISGCPSGGSGTTYRIWANCYVDGVLTGFGSDVGNGLTIELTEETSIGIGCEVRNGATVSNLTFKPMLCLASITDDTWEQPTNGATPRPDYPQEIEVSGESYNLAPYPYSETTHEEDGITWTDVGDGTIIANGTASENSDLQIKARNTGKYVLKAGTYILSGCPSGGSNKTYRIGANYTNSSGTATSLGDDYGDGVTFTINEDTLGEGCYIGVFITIFKGTTAENLTFKPMIRKATVKNDRYMPYGVGSVEVYSCRKNLAKLEQGTLAHDSTGEEVDSNIRLRTNFIPIKPFTDYITSSDKKLGIRNGVIYDENKNRIIHGVYPNPTTGILNVTNSKARYIRLLYGNDTNSNINPNDYKYQFELGTVVTPYVEYQEPLMATATIPTENGLAGIKVSSNGNYTDQNGQQWICDEVVKYADGSGAYIQRIGRLISSNSVGWYKIGGSQNQEDRFGIEVGVKMLQCVGISNYNHTVDNWGTSDNGIGFGVGASTTIYARFSGIESLETLNEKFSNIPFTTYYGLVEPITTPLTAEELAEISTFYPITNISNDADCGMSVKYNADSKNYIDKNLAEMEKAQEQAMMSMFLLLPEETQATMIENDVNNLLTESEI